MGFNPNQPRRPDGEFTGLGGGGARRSTTHTNSPFVTGSFASPRSAASPTPRKSAASGGRAGQASHAKVAQKSSVKNAQKAAPTRRSDSVTRRADALNAAGKNAKAQKVVKSALAQNAHQLEQNRAKQAEVKARLAENKAKIARSKYVLKNGLAGATDAQINAHMAAHGKKK